MSPTPSTLRLPTVLLAMVLQACAGDSRPLPEPPLEEVSPVLAVPAGMGHYCSMLWPAQDWAFAWEPDTSSAPCEQLRARSAGGNVARAGLYSAEGRNNVISRCEDGTVGLWSGLGASPLQSAHADATKHQRKGCVFTAAPDALPIFDAPFSLVTRVFHATGFDFAQDVPLDVADFGQTGSTTAHIVDHLGRDQSNANFVNNHDGHDWGMITGTPILAVANGTVLLARDREVPCASPIQKEVYVQHDVGSGEYLERFVSYYAHFKSYVVTAGQVVRKGQVLGYAGSTGCSSAPHLHLAVARLTNTASEYRRDYSIPSTDHPPMTSNIEVYGWAAPSGFDPWAWRNHPSGALSIDLWNEGQAPVNPNF
ncbi:M23 family metallopeptidase [Myxococcus fulvus]|uniref:M23 family metallopeptidase n=1 Tax=Myxococcus fulvus TaxID=33 RepID=UPI003B9C918A